MGWQKRVMPRSLRKVRVRVLRAGLGCFIGMRRVKGVLCCLKGGGGRRKGD